MNLIKLQYSDGIHYANRDECIAGEYERILTVTPAGNITYHYPYDEENVPTEILADAGERAKEMREAWNNAWYSLTLFEQYKKLVDFFAVRPYSYQAANDDWNFSKTRLSQIQFVDKWYGTYLKAM